MVDNFFSLASWDLSTALLGAVGFSLALYIHRHKKKSKPLVCPLRSNCEAVIHSDYSRFVGIPVELLGIYYYLATTLFHAFLVFSPNLTHPAFFLSSLVVATGAFLFSLYLVSVQLFILKQICTWCLLSATISTIIFLITFFSTHFVLGPFIL